ncbi:MAG: hypothetical protein U5L09_00840 [Bacteroidales bacterium]|nr:hypothetical protein [Bacteroidales bacterium]
MIISRNQKSQGKAFCRRILYYAYLETTKTNFEENVTPKHLDVRKDSISFHYQNLISYMQQSEAIRVNPEIETSVHVIYSVLNDMIRETQEEIAEAEARNKVIEKHGTYTLLFSGLAFMLIISYFST